MFLTRHIPGIAIALVALALVLRLAFVAVTPGYVPQHDDHGYDRLACALVVGEGYTRIGPPTPREGCGRSPQPGNPTGFRPPGYPVFLAGVYAVAEPLGVQRWTVARIVQAVVGTIAVALLGVVAWQLWGRRVASIALALGAVFPPAIVLGGSLLNETLLGALTLGAIAAVLADRRAGGSRRWLALAGVLCGLAVITRSNAPALLLPLAIAVALTGERRLRARIGRAAALAGIALLVVAPWTLRNAMALDAFVPISTQNGAALAGTYNDRSREDPRWPGAWRPPARLRVFAPQLERVYGDEAAEQRVLVDGSLDYMADHPGYVLELGVRNVWRLSGLEGRAWWHFSGRTLSLPGWTADLSGAAFLPFLVLAVAGAFTREARRAPRWLWLMPLLMLLSVVFVVGEMRFRAPIDPFVLLLAALAIARLAPRRSGDAHTIPA
jgi:4-amino-4-deoxy-L-arabinose transferase-like glycosyltransferase